MTNKNRRLRASVQRAYSLAAEKPWDKHPFPVGRQFAESLGYPRYLLDGLPNVSLDAFSGVSNVSVFAQIPAGVVVLDVGCGAGTDSFIAAQRTGPKGRVITVDFDHAMLTRARQAAFELRISNMAFSEIGAENLPVEDETVNAALANGIFNLDPARDAIFCELARVVKQGGAVYAAELILRKPLPLKIRDTKPAGLLELLELRKAVPSQRSSGRLDAAKPSCYKRNVMPALKIRTRVLLTFTLKDSTILSC